MTAIVARDRRKLLDIVSLSSQPGARLALRGGNGVSKTTLLHVIIGLQPGTAGTVALQRRICRTERDFRDGHSQTGALFQDSDGQPFSPTAIEGVTFGPLNQGHGRLPATNRAARQLDGLARTQLVRRPMHQLSGREKPLVCLAGLLVTQPDLLLDARTTGFVAAADGGSAVSRGAMIVVSHGCRPAQHATATEAQMQDGHVIHG